jgi:hypothetical protein
MSGSLRGEELSGGIGLNGQNKLNVGLSRGVVLCMGLLCFHNVALVTTHLSLERPLTCISYFFGVLAFIL